VGVGVGAVPGVGVDYYEKYCICGLTANILANKVYSYDTPLTGTTVYELTDAFNNPKSPKCEINSCTLLEWPGGASSATADCTVPVAYPMNTYFLIETVSPWKVKISQTK